MWFDPIMFLKLLHHVIYVILDSIVLEKYTHCVRKIYAKIHSRVFITIIIYKNIKTA